MNLVGSLKTIDKNKNKNCFRKKMDKVEETDKMLSILFEKSGFKQVNLDKIKHYTTLYENDLGIKEGSLKIFNRGKDSKSSNYFIFTCIKDNHFFVVSYNPAPPTFLKDENLENEIDTFGNDEKDPTKREDLFYIREFDPTKDDPFSFCKKTSDYIFKLAKFKPKNRYYYSPHSHIGEFRRIFNGDVEKYIPIKLKENEYFENKGPIDDGKTNIFDAIFSAALYAEDYFCMTSHNSFCAKVYDKVKDIADIFSISTIPGMELTMPLYGYDASSVGYICDMIKENMIKQIKKEIRNLSISNLNEEINNFKSKYSFFIKFDNVVYEGKYSNSQLRRIKRELRKQTIKQIKEKNIIGEELTNQNGVFEYGCVLNLIEKYSNYIDKKNLPSRVINGPHVLFLCQDKEIAREIHLNYLHKDRDFLYAPLSSPNISFFKTIKELKEKYDDKIIIYLAHPFNENSLPDVGVGMRLKSGDLSIVSFLDLVFNGYIDGMCAYNPSVNEDNLQHFKIKNDKKIRTNDPWAKKLTEQRNQQRQQNLKESKTFFENAVIRKWRYWTNSPNSLNMAFTKWIYELARQRGIHLKLVSEEDIHWYGNADITKPLVNHFARTYSYVQTKNEMDKSISSFFDMSKLHKLLGNNGEVVFNYIAYAYFNLGNGNKIRNLQDLTDAQKEKIREMTKELFNNEKRNKKNIGKLIMEKGRSPNKKEMQSEIHATTATYFRGGIILISDLFKDKNLSILNPFNLRRNISLMINRIKRLTDE